MMLTVWKVAINFLFYLFIYSSRKHRLQWLSGGVVIGTVDLDGGVHEAILSEEQLANANSIMGTNNNVGHAISPTLIICHASI